MKSSTRKLNPAPWNLDEALRLIGPRGRWQMGVYLLIGAMYATLGFHWLAFVFQVDTPSHHCKIPPSSIKNESIPKISKDGKLVDDSCSMYVNFSLSNDTMPCNNGWEYDPNSGYISTIVTDFDLVCGENILVEISMMISNAAMAVGQVFSNKLADTFGRRTIFLVGCFGRTVTRIAQAFSPNMTTYMILDVLGFVSMSCFASMLLLLCCELFPPEFRSFAQTTMEFAWFTSTMLCTLIVYLFRDWRVMHLVMHCPLILGMAFYWLVPESLRWLMENGKYDQLRRHLELGGRINKKPIPPEFFEGKKSSDMATEEDLQENEMKETSEFGSKGSEGSVHVTTTHMMYGSGIISLNVIGSKERVPQDDYEEVHVMDVWRSKRMIFITLTLFILWLVNSIIYSALSLTVTYLSGDRYLNFLFLNLAELPAIICFHWALNRYGRRIPLCVFHVITGVALLLTLLEVFGVAPAVFGTVMNFVGRFGVSASYCAMLVYSPELFPTNIRSVYFGACYFWATVGSLIAPYCRPLELAIPGIVRGICAVLSFIAAVLVLFMPETFRRALPKSVKEVTKWTRKVSPEEVEKYNMLRENENKAMPNNMSSI